MSFEFQSTLVNVTPNFRISGANIGGLRILQNGDIKVARLVVTNDRDIQFALSGPYEAGDPDAIYAALSSDLYELVPGILVNEGAISSIEMTSEQIIIDLEGADLKYAFEPDAAVTGPIELNSHSYKLSPAGFAALSTAAAIWRSSMDGTLEGLATTIATETADRIAADSAIQADVDQNEADADAAMAAEIARVDALIASGMWLYADQAAFPPAADNHGRVVHSHADGAIFYAHGGMWHQVAREVDLQTTIASLASEASTREAADTTLQANIDAEAATRAADDTTEANTRSGADAALSARLDVLEADPTTATAVAAGDAATLSSANTYTDGEIATEASARTSADASLSGRLDVLETDPTTATAVAAVQSDVDQNEADSDAADAALSGRLDVLEADPTTATAVAAVQADVDANEADADAALALKAPLADPDFTGLLEVDTNARLEFDSNLTKLHNVLRGTSIVIGNNITLNPAAADGRVEIEGEFYLRPSDLTNAADDTAAAAAGVIVGQVYRNGSQLMVRVS